MHFNNDTNLYRVIVSNTKHYRKQRKLTQVQLTEQAKIASVLDVKINKFFKKVDTE